jgi:hypothetical protein
VLEFEEPVGVVEGFQRSSELGGYNRWQHNCILICPRWLAEYVQMLEQYLYCTVIGERPEDDLPCNECGACGPIVLVERRGAEFPDDLCRACLAEARRMEQRLKAEDRERKLQAFVENIPRHKRVAHPDIFGEDMNGG